MRKNVASRGLDVNDAESVSATESAGRLKRSVRRGARIALYAQIASQLISLAVLASLYRLVAPADFGLFGVVMPVLMLVRNLATLGLGAAAVQLAEMPQGVATALFWWNVWIGLAAVLATALAAPWVGLAYGTAEACWLTLSLSGTALLAALGTQHQALLERRMAWDALAKARLAGQAAAGFGAVQLAVNGAGLWSLVAQQYLEAFVTTMLVWRYASWRPGAPRQSASIRHSLGFGGHFAGAGLMFFLAQNIDKTLLGIRLRGLEQTATGYYTQAFNLMMRPVSLLTAPLNSLMLPALSQARNDAAAFRTVYLSFQRLIANVMFPAGIGLLVTAPEVVILLGGEDWRGAIAVLQALTPAMLVQGFVSTASSAFGAVGHADRLFAASVVIAIGMGAGCWGVLWRPSVLGTTPDDAGPAIALATAYSLLSITVFCGYQLYCLKTIGVPFAAWRRTVARPFAAAVVMGMLTWAAREYPYRRHAAAIEQEPALQFAMLVAEVAFGVACYVLFAWPECRWCLAQWRHRE